MEINVSAFIQASVSRRELHEQVGPFLVGFDANSDNRFRNWAVPDDGAEPTPTDIAALVAAFRRRERIPRLEYMPAAAPAVEPALLAAGWQIEGAPPVMGCTPADLVDVPAPSGVHITFVDTASDLYDAATVQHKAYGEPDLPQEHDVARLRRTVERGGVVALARDGQTGEAVGACLGTEPLAGVTEVAGMAVAESHRRRGIGAAVAAALTSAAFDRGITAAWLEPAGDAEERIYARVGYRAIGEKRYLVLEPAG